MSTRTIWKAVFAQVWNVLSFFGTSIFCGLANAAGLVILLFVVDGIGFGAFHFSTARMLENFLENTFTLKTDPLADTIPAFLALAVLGYICGCLYGAWLHAKCFHSRDNRASHGVLQ